MRKFQVNDIVELNSGGPALRVISVEKDNVTVEFTNETNEREQLTMPAVCFKAIPKRAAQGDEQCH